MPGRVFSHRDHRLAGQPCGTPDDVIVPSCTFPCQCRDLMMGHELGQGWELAKLPELGILL